MLRTMHSRGWACSLMLECEITMYKEPCLILAPNKQINHILREKRDKIGTEPLARSPSKVGSQGRGRGRVGEWSVSTRRINCRLFSFARCPSGPKLLICEHECFLLCPVTLSLAMTGRGKNKGQLFNIPL